MSRDFVFSFGNSIYFLASLSREGDHGVVEGVSADKLTFSLFTASKRERSRSDLAAVFCAYSREDNILPYSSRRDSVLFVGTGGLLRFGHARGLTAHRAVIQHLRAATLPRLSVKFKQSHLRRERLNAYTILSTLFLYPVGETPCFLLKRPLK